MTATFVNPDHTWRVVACCIIGMVACVCLASIGGGTERDRKRKLVDAAQVLCPHGVLSVRIGQSSEPVIECQRGER